MNSIAFPQMFNKTVTNLTSDYYATLQNIKMLLLSEKGELFGDPYYGTGLKKYMFEQNDVVLQDLLVDDLYTALKLFIPQIKVDRKDITVVRTDKGEVTITIKAMNKADYTTNLYSIVLDQASV